MTLRTEVPCLFFVPPVIHVLAGHSSRSSLQLIRSSYRWLSIGMRARELIVLDAKKKIKKKRWRVGFGFIPSRWAI